MVSDLTVYLQGWVGYFGFRETPWELRDLDGWIRRRLRAVRQSDQAHVVDHSLA
jgi:RNA-directed DNA polymerase